MTPSIGRFAAALGSLSPAAKVEALLREILTPGEFHDLALRWELVELLAAGVSQRQIAARLGVSLCKITRGAKILKIRNGVVASLVTKKAAARPVKKQPVRPAKRQTVRPAKAIRAKPVKKAALKPSARKPVRRDGTRVAR